MLLPHLTAQLHRGGGGQTTRSFCGSSVQALLILSSDLPNLMQQSWCAGLEPASANPVHVRKEQPAWLRRSSEPAAAAPAASSQQETSSVKLEPEHSAAVTSSGSAPALSPEVATTQPYSYPESCQEGSALLHDCLGCEPSSSVL